MKYLILFEAFESIQLSKIFAYLSIEGKNKFLEDLKLVSNYLDYPLSEFSDDDFQYLPFKRAYELNNPDAESLEMIKFWFTKDGDYIDKTLINGKNISSSELPSKNISDYFRESDDLTFSEIKELETGQLVYLDCSGGSGPGYIFVSNGYTFVLQNFAQGSSPSDYHRGRYGVSEAEWRDIADYSWVIGETDDYYSVYKIKYKYKEKDNFNISFNIRGDERSDYSLNSDIKSKSHFSLILDVTKLPDVSLGKIRSGRKERKKGAFLTDEEVKSQNIKRYFDEIFKDEKILSDPNRIIKRLLIGEDFLFFYSFLGIKNVLGSIKNDYYKAISQDDSIYIDGLRKTIIDFNKRYNSVKKTVKDNINYIKNDLSSDIKKGTIENSDYLNYIENIEEISKVLYKRISSFKIENIYDIEMLYHKLMIFDNLINNDINYFHRSYNIISSIYDINTIKYYLYDGYRDYEILKFNEVGFNRLKELIKRL